MTKKELRREIAAGLTTLGIWIIVILIYGGFIPV